MATTAVDRVFVDTNVLVYSAVSAAPLHGAAVKALADLRKGGAELWISRQILREYIATQTRPQVYALPLSAATVAADVVAYQQAFRIAEDDHTVTTQLLALLVAVPIGGKQVHDANIVAPMLAYRIPKLLTHNTVDFARFASFITVEALGP